MFLSCQNLCIRIYLEKKKEKKKKKEEEEKQAALKQQEEDGYGYETAFPQSAHEQATQVEKENKKKEGGPKKPNILKRIFANKDDYPEALKIDRAPFRADGKTSSTSKIQPRCVVVPYTRFRKERFFDWPPDPTVSRATPLPPLVDYFMENMDDESDFDLDNESTNPAYGEVMFEFDEDSDFPDIPGARIAPRKVKNLTTPDNDSDAPAYETDENNGDSNISVGRNGDTNTNDSVTPMPSPMKSSKPKVQPVSDFPGVSLDFPGVKINTPPGNLGADFPGVKMNRPPTNNVDFPGVNMQKKASANGLRQRRPPPPESKPATEEYQYQDDWSD